MTVIELRTEISADIAVCFDCARDIDLHMLSTSQTNEKAIAGRTSGLCEFGDTITWEAKHFGITQQLTSAITGFNRPVFFEDTMLTGAFKSLRHEHHFEERNGKTVMRDYFTYEVPFGIAGELFNKLVLKTYMTEFLIARNGFLKTIAEKRPVKI